MYLDRRHTDTCNGITDRVCIVRVSTRIDDDAVVRAARRLQFIDDRAFGIVLHALHAHAEVAGFTRYPGIDLGERLRSVGLGLARPEQVEIGPVDHENVHARGVRGGNARALGKCDEMPDRIVTSTAVDGSFSVVAGITTELVRETQQRHELAPTASAAVGRLLTGATLLGASLKGREKLTLQIASDGPLRGIVADVQLGAQDEIGARGYTRRPSVDVPLNERGKFDVGGAVGKGYLQVTRSFEVGQPYVGIVELQSGEIGDDIAAYLMTSEQIPSVVALGVLANAEGIKASGGAIAQVLPGADERTIAALEERVLAMPPITAQIDAGATPDDLVAAIAGRLEMRARREYTVAFTCTCSRERVERALLGLGRDELAKIVAEQTQTEALCEFCKTAYVLSRDEVHALIERLEARN